MKILLLGYNGNIGNFLTNFLSKNHTIISLNKELLDITDKKQVQITLKKLSPDIVVQAAGISDVDFCEKNQTESYTVNSLGTLNVASSCNQLNIPILYISSSYVYGDTKNTSYFETDKCDPVNIYGKSKLAGEKLIRTVCKKYFIIRTSWCFGGSKCYVKQVLDNINTPIFMSSTDIVNPTSLDDLSSAINKIIETDFYGVYNCVNDGFAEKKEVISFIFDSLGIDKKIITLPESTKELIAPRPSYSNLSISLINNCFNIKMPTWQESLKKYLKELTSDN